ncbi:MAG TPA: hypothetical protein VIJ57_08290 [Hanamia sp.]
MFYNTIDLTGHDLEKAKAYILKQEELISAIYKRNAGKAISPSQILDIIRLHYGFNWPLTSVRRSITNLTDKAALIKLEKMTEGIYGKPEHLWKFNLKIIQVDLF